MSGYVLGMNPIGVVAYLCAMTLALAITWRLGYLSRWSRELWVWSLRLVTGRWPLTVAQRELIRPERILALEIDCGLKSSDVLPSAAVAHASPSVSVTEVPGDAWLRRHYPNAKPQPSAASGTVTVYRSPPALSTILAMSANAGDKRIAVTSRVPPGMAIIVGAGDKREVAFVAEDPFVPDAGARPLTWFVLALDGHLRFAHPPGSVVQCW